MTSSGKMWHVHWCVFLLASNHDQLSPIYLFKHCLLLVAVEVIYRVCHILWLLIISLILFYVEKNCCQELKISRCIHPSFLSGSGQASGLQISHPSTHLSSRLPHASPHYSASLSFSPYHFTLALLPVSFRWWSRWSSWWQLISDFLSSVTHPLHAWPCAGYLSSLDTLGYPLSLAMNSVC